MHLKRFPYFVIILFIQKILCVKYGMTKIECETIDAKVMQFYACELVPVSKQMSELTVKIRVVKIPLRNIKIRVALTVPGVLTVYNDTWDICALLSKRKSNRAFNDWIRPGLREFTNINHSCPYNHDLHFVKMPQPATEAKFALFGDQGITLVDALVNGKKAVSLTLTYSERL
ncbi:uncharacterized protein LOC131996031 [Stomoxys calcitrans]|uniref:uncharacterized protein LOC131996031 n=1 Tax=Stomoxys calcitrans TaxID=35570 RepID=UPI0027E286D9|nr:uncharacterized protein LOC131996031 [Stomoxys calcitrans]